MILAGATTDVSIGVDVPPEHVILAEAASGGVPPGSLIIHVVSGVEG